MLIRSNQIQAFSGAQSNRFVHETVSRLRIQEPDWAGGRSDGELCVQIEEIIAFAAGARIRKREAVLAIIEAFIRHAPPKPLDPRLIQVLQQPNIPELVRAEQFYISLASGRHCLQEIQLTF